MKRKESVVKETYFEAKARRTGCYSIRQLSEMLNVRSPTVREWKRTGVIPSNAIDFCGRLKKAKIDELIACGVLKRVVNRVRRPLKNAH